MTEHRGGGQEEEKRFYFELDPLKIIRLFRSAPHLHRHVHQSTGYDMRFRRFIFELHGHAAGTGQMFAASCADGRASRRAAQKIARAA